LGIGLTLVKTLVQMHGGSVEAGSDGVGRGSTFTVRLPVSGEISALEAQPASALDSSRVRPRRILVVDDNRDSAESLAMLLSLSGHEVRTANDGLAALDVARAFQPRVVLLDLGMPRLNGYDAARAIRAEPWGSDLVLIALTGWGQEEDKRRTAEAGFNAHLIKPVDHVAFEELLTSLDVDQAGQHVAGN
jgi:CheY-like chemotaxis protein